MDNKLARPMAVKTINPNLNFEKCRNEILQDTDLESWVSARGDVMKQSAAVMFNFTEQNRMIALNDGNCLLPSKET